MIMGPDAAPAEYRESSVRAATAAVSDVDRLAPPLAGGSDTRLHDLQRNTRQEHVANTDRNATQATPPVKAPEFIYEDVCRIFLTHEGKTSTHAGAQMFYRIRNLVSEAAPYLAQWDGDAPEYEYVATMVNPSRAETVFLGIDTIRVGSRVAFVGEEDVRELLADLERGRAGMPLLSEEQFNSTLRTFSCR